MPSLKHSFMTAFIVTTLVGFGSACSEEDKASQQMLKDAQARLTLLDAKAATDSQCKTVATGCRASLKACMPPPESTTPPSSADIQRCMGAFDTCIGANCK